MNSEKDQADAVDVAANEIISQAYKTFGESDSTPVDSLRWRLKSYAAAAVEDVMGSLQTMIKEPMSPIEGLTADLKFTKHENDHLRTELETMKASVDDLKQRLEQAEIEKEKVTTELQDLREEHAGMKNGLVRCLRDNSVLEIRFKQMQKEKSIRQQMLEKVRNENDNLQVKLIEVQQGDRAACVDEKITPCSAAVSPLIVENLHRATQATETENHICK